MFSCGKCSSGDVNVDWDIGDTVTTECIRCFHHSVVHGVTLDEFVRLVE